LQKVVGIIFVVLDQCLRQPHRLKTVDYTHQLSACIAKDVSAFLYQVLSKRHLDFEVIATKIVATGTLKLNYQNAEVIVLALALACFIYPKDAFTALAFEPQLLHFFT
jgi:hypothetical protein